MLICHSYFIDLSGTQASVPSPLPFLPMIHIETKYSLPHGIRARLSQKNRMQQAGDNPCRNTPTMIISILFEFSSC